MSSNELKVLAWDLSLSLTIFLTSDKIFHVPLLGCCHGGRGHIELNVIQTLVRSRAKLHHRTGQPSRPPSCVMYIN